MHPTLFARPLALLLALAAAPALATGPAPDATWRLVDQVSAAELFGVQRRIFHPTLTVGGAYTDNLFNTRSDREGDYSVRLAPGFWLAVPGTEEVATGLVTSPTTPGGVAVTREVEGGTQRLQGSLRYGAVVERFADFSGENTVEHLAEGALALNLRGGLGVDLADQFQRSQDSRGSGTSTDLDRFHTNLASGAVRFAAGPRLGLGLTFSHFLVDYLDARNDARDRRDLMGAGTVAYRLTAKTAMFAQYQWLDVRYAEDTGADSREDHVFGGVTWRATAKSKGEIKLGWGRKRFAGSGVDDSTNVLVQARVAHAFTPKTALSLVGSRRTEETDVPGTDYTLTHRTGLRLTQQLALRLRGNLDLTFADVGYLGGAGPDRRDRLYGTGAGLRYAFLRWLRGDLAYTHTRRDSNGEAFDYRANSVLATITAEL